MVLKKKKTAGVEQKEPERMAVVTQVVEVVGDEGGQSMSEMPQEREEHEEAISAEAQAPEFIPDEPEVSQKQSFSEQREEHQKQTVAELFKRPAPEVMPEIAEHREKPKRNKLLLIGGIAILIMVLGGIVVVKGKSLRIATMFSAAPTPTPTPTITPTPTPEPVKKADIKIQVWNGGGVSGAASKMKSFLEDKGYKVADVSNADAYTYDKTEIQVKEGKENILKLLTEDLKDTYTLASKAATLSSDVSYDARIVVGKE